MAVLAIDIGGTKLAGGVVDTEGRILARGEVPTLAAEGLEPVLGRIVGLGRDLLSRPEAADVSVHRVGVGCAGPVDLKTGIVFNPPNLPGWVRVPLIDHLQQALALPAVLENDANAAALGEFRYGAGRGARSIVYMTVSTGIGGGIILAIRSTSAYGISRTLPTSRTAPRGFHVPNVMSCATFSLPYVRCT